MPSRSGASLDAWGVKGWIKVQPFATDPQALFSSRRWFLQPPEEPRMRPTGRSRAASRRC